MNADARAGTDKSRILIVCPHYPPSTEVGARRVSALAKTLSDDGYEILVLSAFGEPYDFARHPLSSEPISVGLAEPKPLLLSRLVLLKKFLQGPARRSPQPAINTSPGRRPAATTAPMSSAPISQAEGTGLLSRLTGEVLAWVGVLDHFKKWSWLAYRYGLRLCRAKRPALIIASGPPFSAVLAASRIARRCGLPFIADFRDPIGSPGKSASLAERFKQHVARRAETYLANTADWLTTASPGTAAVLGTRSADARQKLSVITNGFDGPLLARSVSTGHQLNIVFAGALYLNRSPYIFLEALESLLHEANIDSSRIVVKFFGAIESVEWRALQSWLVGKKSQLVMQIFPEVPLSQLKPHLESAGVTLNFAQWQPNQIPAKTFEQLRLGCEQIAVCEENSDTAKLLDNLAGIHVVEPTDIKRMNAVLVDLYARHVGRGLLTMPDRAQIQEFSRTAQNRKFSALVRQIAGPPSISNH